MVKHGNTPYRPLSSTQSQADVLRYLRDLIWACPVKQKYYHILGHLDQILSPSELTLEELANVSADHMADDSLKEGLATGTFIDPLLPNEKIVVSVDGVKVSGSPADSITRAWGDKTAKEHYHSKGIIDSSLFDEVYWDGVERLFKRSPEMWSVWATKQTSGFCAANHMLARFKTGVIDACPNCGFTPERAHHIHFCSDPGRLSVFHSSVTKLTDWLVEQKTDPELVRLLTAYLRSRGSRPMLSLSPNPRHRQLAHLIDSLGYVNLLEGRITKLFLTLRQEDITRRQLRKHAGHWCVGLLQCLLQITHRQWTYRNGTVKIRVRDGLITERQQLLLMQQCEDLLWTDPSALLDDDRYLLDIDFEALGDAPANMRQMWVAEMEAATTAAGVAAETSLDPGEGHLGTARLCPPVDTEGSIRFRCRRRRTT